MPRSMCLIYVCACTYSPGSYEECGLSVESQVWWSTGGASSERARPAFRHAKRCLSPGASSGAWHRNISRAACGAHDGSSCGAPTDGRTGGCTPISQDYLPHRLHVHPLVVHVLLTCM